VGCCGETAQGRLTITQKDIDNGLALQLEYGGGRTVRITGPVTGKTYVFSGLQRLGHVDPRDAPAILRDRLFRLKGVTRPRPVGTNGNHH
jgi:hypothetical protein